MEHGVYAYRLKSIGGVKTAVPSVQSVQVKKKVDMWETEVEALIKLIEDRRGGVTFVEIEDELVRLGLEVKGDYAITTEERPMTVWWGLVSMDFVEIIAALMKTKRVEIRGVGQWVYMVDGRMPSLPLAKQDRAYKTEHWAPLVFYPAASS